MKREKMILWIAQVLVFLNAAIWLVAGGAWLVSHSELAKMPQWLALVMAAGMLGYGAVLALLGFGLPARRKLVYYPALVLTGLAVVLTIFDDFGWADLLAALPSLAAFVYLLVNKNTLCAARQ